MRRGRSGFTILELLVGIFILGVVLSVGALTFGQSMTAEQSRGLGYSLAAELRAARVTATQKEMYVAVCIPNDGGTNPFSRSFAVRGGYDRPELLRTVNFDKDQAATVYSGPWGGSALSPDPQAPQWVKDSPREFRLVFRPDGTAFSENLGALDGKFHFVVGARMTGSAERLTAVTRPTTVWVSKAGTVGILENSLPAGSLPASNDVPQVAQLSPPDRTAKGREPVIASVDFLPLKVDEIQNVGLGQTAVQIHPQQKLPGMGQEGVEYGLTTFRFRAKDPDGGPLFFSVSAEASKGEAGNFSYEKSVSALGPTTGGQMNFVQTERGDWVWEAVISWRPPPGAASDTVYDFLVTVEDPEGNKTELASGAELLPRIVLLLPENIVYQTDDDQLMMTNLDGTSHRLLTSDDEPEHSPFFSSDGTRLYSFQETDTELSMITRNADGTQRKKLQAFPKAYFRKLTFDPFKNYVAYLAGSSNVLTVNPVEEYSEQVAIPGTESSGGESGSSTPQYVTVWKHRAADPITVNIDHLEVMHLNSGKRVSISDHAKENFKWYGNPRFGLAYTEIEISPMKKGHPQDPQALALGLASPLPDYRPKPGVEEKNQGVLIREYPPVAKPHVLPVMEAGLQTEVFNLSQPDLYLQCNETAPCLTFKDLSGSLPDQVLMSSKVESPSWSKDGQWVLYARSNGGNTMICRQKVLDPSLTAMDLEGEEVLYQASGILTPQLSASGDHAFFLRGGDLYRLDVNNRKAPINLTKNLSKGVLSFVLSP